MRTTASNTRHSFKHIVTNPLSSAIGAEIQCGDLRKISDETFTEIHQAWLDSGIVIIRGQSLEAGGLVAFSQGFGVLDESPTALKAGRYPPGFPQILVVTNTVFNGASPEGGLNSAEAYWHTDMSYVETPPKASLLYSVEIPPTGGNTGFANMSLALETLAPAIRKRIETLTIKHDACHNSAGILRKGLAPVTDVTTSPGPSHPIIRTHPETGRDALFLGRREYAYVDGLSITESEALLNVLWKHATRDEFSWHHVWKLGDLIIWDNRCVMHRRDPFDPNSRRVMFRTQVRGDKSFQAKH